MGVFGIAACAQTLSSLWIIFFVKESVTKRKVEIKEVTEEKEKACSRFFNVVKSSILYLLDSFRTVIRPRQGYRRLVVFLGALIYFLFISTWTGLEGTHRFLFLDKKYHWTEENTSIYLFISQSSKWFGLWVLLPTMKNFLKLSDVPIAIIGLCFALVGRVKFNFSSTIYYSVIPLYI